MRYSASPGLNNFDSNGRPKKIRDGPAASHNHVGHEKLSVLDESSLDLFFQ